MRRLDVLVSGAGIAGCTLAYWLARYGHSAIVVERSGALRSSGSPVDVRGPAAQVVERMDIVPRLRDASTRIAGITLAPSSFMSSSVTKRGSNSCSCFRNVRFRVSVETSAVSPAERVVNAQLHRN